MIYIAVSLHKYHEMTNYKALVHLAISLFTTSLPCRHFSAPFFLMPLQFLRMLLYWKKIVFVRDCFQLWI